MRDSKNPLEVFRRFQRARAERTFWGEDAVSPQVHADIARGWKYIRGGIYALVFGGAAVTGISMTDFSSSSPPAAPVADAGRTPPHLRSELDARTQREQILQDKTRRDLIAVGIPHHEAQRLAFSISDSPHNLDKINLLLRWTEEFNEFEPDMTEPNEHIRDRQKQIRELFDMFIKSAKLKIEREGSPPRTGVSEGGRFSIDASLNSGGGNEILRWLHQHALPAAELYGNDVTVYITPYLGEGMGMSKAIKMAYMLWALLNAEWNSLQYVPNWLSLDETKSLWETIAWLAQYYGFLEVLGAGKALLKNPIFTDDVEYSKDDLIDFLISAVNRDRGTPLATKLMSEVFFLNVIYAHDVLLHDEELSPHSRVLMEHLRVLIGQPFAIENAVAARNALQE